MSKLDEFYRRGKALEREVEYRQVELARMRKEIVPEIRRLRREADALAQSFKQLVKEAPLAYADGRKAEAKQISERRKAQQAQCEALNAEAQRLQDRLNEMRAWKDGAFEDLGIVERVITRLRAGDPTRDIPMPGFAQAYGVSEAIVRDELSVLAPVILDFIDRVEYRDEARRDTVVGLTGKKELYPDRTPIWLFINPETFEREELERSYRQVVVHEAGHVLFDWIMTSQQRLQWGEMYLRTRQEGGPFVSDYARESKREDFGECFAGYMQKPQKLFVDDPMRYTFINNVYKELER